MSKNCCMGARISSVRGALPREPFAGRMKAEEFTIGSHSEPIVQELEYSGFFNGTPGTMSSRIARLVPPSRLVSVMIGTNGCPPCIRKTLEMVQPPITPLTSHGA